jgi:hypothetical protein
LQEQSVQWPVLRLYFRNCQWLSKIKACDQADADARISNQFVGVDRFDCPCAAIRFIVINGRFYRACGGQSSREMLIDAVDAGVGGDITEGKRKARRMSTTSGQTSSLASVRTSIRHSGAACVAM